MSPVSAAVSSSPVISIGGGLDPLWARDGGALYYRLENQIYKVVIDDLDSLAMGEPVLVYEGEFEGRAAYGKANWEISLEGERYLVSMGRTFALEPQINVIIGWLH